MNIEEQIFRICKKIKDTQEIISNLKRDDHEQFEIYTRELFDLKIKLQRLEKDAYLYRNPDLESDEIDLYLKNLHKKVEENPEGFKYIITLHGAKTKIGEMELRFSLLENEKHLGNIGANIDEDYRGKRYSKKAFMLLRDVLVENGIKKPIFTVRDNNISSIKSLDAIGAKRVDYINCTNKPYYVYEYDLEQDENIKK